MLDFLKNGSGKILKLFFQDPDKEYYLREIAKQLGQEPGHFQYYLNSLTKEGILADEYRANLRYFRLNKDHPLYKELKSIVSKTLGAEAQLKELAGSLDGVECAFIFGSIAKNTENGANDIDLMLIGKTDQNKLIIKIKKAEEELAREINYHIFDKNEVIRKLKEKNDFLTHIFSGPIINLKGNSDEFRQIN